MHRSIEIYGALFEHYAGWDWDTARRCAGAFEAPVGAAHPHLLEEIRGIAEGAGVAFADILALNVRTEIMGSGIARRPPAECTAFAALPEATSDGHVLIGQNWDWNPRMCETVVVLDVERDDGPDYVTVVEAGLLAKSGMNSAGVGLVTNALISLQDVGAPGLPYHVLLRAILDAETLLEAIEVVTRDRRASSANYLIAHRDGSAVDLEAAPGDGDRVSSLPVTQGVLAHANHYVCAPVGVADAMPAHTPDTLDRLERAQRLLADAGGRIDRSLVQGVLRDHAGDPGGICRHVDPASPEHERSVTVASVVLDLTSAQLWLADGAPCRHEYRLFDYSRWLRRSTRAGAGEPT